MLDWVTRHMLPHLPVVPHLHVKRPLFTKHWTLDGNEMGYISKWVSKYLLINRYFKISQHYVFYKRIKGITSTETEVLRWSGSETKKNGFLT